MVRSFLMPCRITERNRRGAARSRTHNPVSRHSSAIVAIRSILGWGPGEVPMFVRIDAFQILLLVTASIFIVGIAYLF